MRIDLIERIEGEALLEYELENGLISSSYVCFPHFRGVEEILKDRPPLDALVIAPRVCGICGHAHLQAAAMALEDAFGATPTQKAQNIRQITRFAEMIQNHIKWFYFVMMAEIGLEFDFGSVQKMIVLINRLAALFSGQWPHSSYVLPGGVTCDPTPLEVVQAKQLLSEVRALFAKRVSFDPIGGDLERFLESTKTLHHKGRGYDRFIVFGNDGYAKCGKILSHKRAGVKVEYIEEFLQPKTHAKGVLYRGKFYETGPLARAMVARVPFIKKLHRIYKDSFYTRVVSRVYEVGILLRKIEELLHFDLDEPSFVEYPKKDGEGVGIVEAARGSLIHKMRIEGGRIESYTIITPTQWNLANGKETLSTLQKALLRTTPKEAQLIFRSFDVCSVCTTH